MRLDNQTAWRTNHLGAFLKRVAVDELDTAQWRALRVAVRTKRLRTHRRRLGATSGRAVVGGGGRLTSTGASMNIYLGPETVDRVRLAHTIAHEMAHIRGMRHRQMRGSPRYTWAAGWEALYAWAETLPLEQKVRKPAPTLDERRARRLEHARTLLSAWERRLRAAQGRVKRWRGRVRNYERHVAIAATQGETT